MDELERNLRGQVPVVRINAREAVGEMLMRRLKVTLVPTFVLLDGNSTERLRVVGRVPEREAVLGALRRSATRTNGSP